MQTHSFEKVLRRAPAPDPEARLRAKRAALEEFARVVALRADCLGQETEAEQQNDARPDDATAGGARRDNVRHVEAQPDVLKARSDADTAEDTKRFRSFFLGRSVLGNLVTSAAAACMTAVMLLPLLFQANEPLLSVPSPAQIAFLSVKPSELELVPVSPPPMVVFEELPDTKVAAPGAINPSIATPSFDIEFAEPSLVIDPSLVGRDAFPGFSTNNVKRVAEEPVSTFSVDVDTVSYSFVRRQLNEGVLPQKDAVRAEELINYFDYAWPAPVSRDPPFSATIAVGDSPWAAGRKLVHIAIKGYELAASEEPAANLVLLLDVSGSMTEPDRLPLAQQSMAMLVSRMKPADTVAIVAYAGRAGVVLEPTEVRERDKILRALEALEPGGSTAGAAGIKEAYELAARNFREGGVNRVLLATDGDFNVGITDVDELTSYVEREREKGIFLSVLGFGAGNYRDEMAQALAQNGNGVAAYIDSLSEARRVLVQEATSSLFTIARDVKLQVEFNPATVAEYRLVGYETRALERADFNNDAVDAGDIGSGHSVTAIYEITPAGSAAATLDELRYAPAQTPAAPAETSALPAAKADEYGYLRIRYKLPDERESRLIEQPILVSTPALPVPVQRDVDFATAVAGFAQLLRGGQHTGSLTYEDVIRQAQAAKGDDPYGHRAEFVELVKKVKTAKGM